MCILLVTTAHPDYALIVLDNRDEFILRPTSNPHWWTSHGQEILSSRDLQRKEQGTWLGITRTGKLAVLTNYRETEVNDANHPIHGTKSRGAMVTGWLTSAGPQKIESYVRQTLEGDGVKGVGGFSLLCGTLRRKSTAPGEIEPLAIISNRAGSPDDVPWVAHKRGEVYGLSNTVYSDPQIWPKVRMGKERLSAVVAEAAAAKFEEEALVQKLYAILDTNTLPVQDGRDFEDYLYELRKSIFIPPIGSETNETISTPRADEIKSAVSAAGTGFPTIEEKSEVMLKDLEEPSPTTGNTGIYGTQRQTIILVDWEGNVSFRERSLWDTNGNPLPRGDADMKFEFKIDGWD